MAGDEGMHLDVLETPQRVRSSLAVAITVRGPPCPTQTPSNVALAVAHDLVSRDFRLMEKWDDEEASAIIGPTMHNDESVAEPPAARQPGTAGARATYDWLHSAYSQLRWDRPPRRRRGRLDGRADDDVRPPDRTF